MITHKNLTKHELIGCIAEVKGSTDPGKVGIRGKVVDETRNTIVLLSKGKEKRIAKKECVFLFKKGNTSLEVDGKDLVGRSSERVKWKKKQAK